MRANIKDNLRGKINVFIIFATRQSRTTKITKKQSDF